MFQCGMVAEKHLRETNAPVMGNGCRNERIHIMARRYELYSSSPDDEVIGCVRGITQAACEVVDGVHGDGTGEALLDRLRTTPVADSVGDTDVAGGDAATWSSAVTEATVGEVLAKRRSENRFSKTDINDTEALRTPSVLYVLWGEIAANRSFGVPTADIEAFATGFRDAIFEVASKLAWELYDEGGITRLTELRVSVDILNARHHAEGWGHIAAAVEAAEDEVRTEVNRRAE